MIIDNITNIQIKQLKSYEVNNINFRHNYMLNKHYAKSIKTSKEAIVG